MRISAYLILLLILNPVTPLRAQDHAHTSPYAGLEERGIASLSEEDISELLAGGGWGFALPAELNGLPGPRHVLDMAGQLDLSDDQHASVQALFDTMQTGAARANLPAVHLGAHLEMLDILTPEQVAAYSRLRGYSSENPCDNVPEGHDEAMWRMHNNCDE